LRSSKDHSTRVSHPAIPLVTSLLVWETKVAVEERDSGGASATAAVTVAAIVGVGAGAGAGPAAGMTRKRSGSQ